MKHQMVTMAGRNSNDSSAVWVVGRRKIWDVTLSVAIMPAGQTLDMDIEASPTGDFDGEEETLASFTQVTSDETTETLSGQGTDFTIVPYRHLYMRVAWTIGGGSDDVYFEVEADAKWLDTSSSSDKDLLRDRLQGLSDLDERLAEAERAIQIHLTRLAVDDVASSRTLSNAPLTRQADILATDPFGPLFTDLGATVGELATVMKEAIAKQMDWDFGTQVMYHRAERGSGSELERLTTMMERRPRVSPHAMDLLRVVVTEPGSFSLTGIP